MYSTAAGRKILAALAFADPMSGSAGESYSRALGVEKYVKPEFLKGRTVSRAVVEEKKRENRIRATGFSVVRWDWADLKEPGKLERMLAAAGVPRRRARSAELDPRKSP